MAKETKNILTREECKNEVIKSIKGDICLYSVILGVAILLFLPFTPLIGKTAATHWALGLLMFFSMFFLHIVLLGILIYNIKVINDVKRHGVTIVVDKAVRLGEEMVYKFPARYRRLANVIYFRDHDKHIYTGTLFELCSHGDEFYLVLSEPSKGIVINVYNTKFFELPLSKADSSVN